MSEQKSLSCACVACCHYCIHVPSIPMVGGMQYPQPVLCAHAGCMRMRGLGCCWGRRSCRQRSSMPTLPLFFSLSSTRSVHASLTEARHATVAECCAQQYELLQLRPTNTSYCNSRPDASRVLSLLVKHHLLGHLLCAEAVDDQVIYVLWVSSFALILAFCLDSYVVTGIRGYALV